MSEVSLKPDSYRVNEKNHVEIGGIALEDLIKEHGSPLYVMCEESLRSKTQEYEKAFGDHYPNHLCVYASKALNCKALCQIMEQEGFGIDVVSYGELHTALSVNFPAEKIFLHGNNKSLEELEMAVEHNIGATMLDNLYELDLLEKILSTKIESGSKVSEPIRLMLRMTPGIECHTHEYIKTGMIDSKFGFNLEDLDKIISKVLELNKKLEEKNGSHVIAITGLHAHIGSQIFETKPHQDLIELFVKLYKEVKDKHGIEFTDMNIGGGLGIKYLESEDPPTVDTWVRLNAEAVKKACAEHQVTEPRILVEPGRNIVGPAGATVYKVGNIKDIPGIRKYVAVDGGMADNTRPIMYQAEYTAQVANKANDPATETVTIAGRYCESGDILIKEIKLPKIDHDDLIVIYSTGAYNYCMASNYNRTTKPAIVLVKDGKSKVIVERESLDDLTRLDKTI